MATKFSDAITQAYTTEWTYINDFRVQITFADEINNYISWNANSAKYDIFLKDISTPQFSNSPIETFIAGKWRFHNGRQELYNITVTFRDYDQLTIYKKMLLAYFYQQNMYFDDAVCTIDLYTGASYLVQTEKKLFNFKNCLITSVSQIQFSNETEAQIAEFSVEFKTATPIFAGYT